MKIVFKNATCKGVERISIEDREFETVKDLIKFIETQIIIEKKIWDVDVEYVIRGPNSVRFDDLDQFEKVLNERLKTVDYIEVEFAFIKEEEQVYIESGIHHGRVYPNKTLCEKLCFWI